MYAIARIKKHQASSIGSVDAHNRRLMHVPNSNGGGYMRKKHDGAPSLSQLINARISDAGIKSKRKDSVVAVEMMMTASPEYFRPGNPKAYGKYDKQRLNIWAKSTIDHLNRAYGDNLVDYVLHLDEATPHIHAVVVPIVEKEIKKRRTRDEIRSGSAARVVVENRLDAKNMFDRGALYRLQDSYASSLSHLGLQRGRVNSRASHETISSYYQKAINSVSRKQEFAYEM